MKNIEKYWETNSLCEIIEFAIRKNWELNALSDLGGVNLRFADVAEAIEKNHILFEAAGVAPGDKVAICGKNSAQWAVTFLSCLTAGVVAVPILHEFKPENIHTLVNHSEAKLIFVDQAIWEQLDPGKLTGLTGAIYLADGELGLSRDMKLTETHADLNEEFGRRFPQAFTPESFSCYHDTPEEICVINYTSGSTGAPKGVMLPYRSIWSNIVYCFEHLTFMHPGDGMVNMLPLGHLYGMVIEMLHPFVKGCHCCFITKAPSPQVLLKAFAEVRPKLIITVPLVIEKIIRSRVFPQLDTPMKKFLLKVPFVNNKIYEEVRRKLIDVFGGEVREIIIGGAPLNAEVEKFLLRINFPLTVGYGMTECGPLLTYAPSAEARPHTVGKVVDRMEMRIDSPDPQKIPGNIYVKGDNVMKGYFKNPEATSEAFPEGDGWMNTGDMGTMDADGFLTINGRSKTMILGPSGQNIYPEEIEQFVNNMPYVAESLVISEDGKLIVLIVPDREAAEKAGLTEDDLTKTMDQNLKSVNTKLESFNRLSSYRLMDKEFEKTPKHSIKRFLYQPKN